MRNRLNTFLLVALLIAQPAWAGSPQPAARRAPSAAEAAAAATPALAVTTPAEPLPRELLDSDRKIEFHLANVASNTQTARYLTGGILIAASGYLSGVYIAQDRFTTGDVAYVAKGVVGATGVLFALGGVLTIAFPGDGERAAGRYRLISGRTPRQLNDKVLFGESELGRLAHRAAVSRRLVGGLFAAVGTADLIWFLGTGPNHQLNFLAYLGGLYTGFGTLFLLMKAPAEQEYDDYQLSKEGTPHEIHRVSFDLMPQPGGAYAGLRWSF